MAEEEKEDFTRDVQIEEGTDFSLPTTLEQNVEGVQGK